MTGISGPCMNMLGAARIQFLKRVAVKIMSVHCFQLGGLLIMSFIMGKNNLSTCLLSLTR